MGRILLEHEAKELLRKHHLPVLDFQLAKNVDQATAAARRLGYPVVIKIVSPQIAHKSEAGGVVINLGSETELRAAYENMMSAIKDYDPGAEIKGVLVSPHLSEATEMIVGVINDSQFGPVVMAGLGGIFVEVFKDVSFGIAPLERQEAAEMLENLKAFPILTGARGRPKLDLELIEDLMVKVSDLALKESIEELDLNPVFCYPDRVLVADARVSLL